MAHYKLKMIVYFVAHKQMEEIIQHSLQECQKATSGILAAQRLFGSSLSRPIDLSWSGCEFRPLEFLHAFNNQILPNVPESAKNTVETLAWYLKNQVVLEMNKHMGCFSSDHNAQVLVVRWDATKKRGKVVFLSQKAFLDEMAPHLVPIPELKRNKDGSTKPATRMISVGKIFINHRFRRQFSTIVFNPRENPEVPRSINPSHAKLVVNFVDEAFFGGDKKDHGILKSLISEKEIDAEEKYQTMQRLEFFCNIVTATNNQNSHPQDQGDRRHAIFRCNPRRAAQGDFWQAWGDALSANNDALYKAIFFYFCYDYRISPDFGLGQRVPVSDMSDIQSENTQDGTMYWIQTILEEGCHCKVYELNDNIQTNFEGERSVGRDVESLDRWVRFLSRNDLYKNYASFSDEHGIRHKEKHKAFWNRVKDYLLDSPSDADFNIRVHIYSNELAKQPFVWADRSTYGVHEIRSRYVMLPTLDKARINYFKKCRLVVYPWDDPADPKLAEMIKPDQTAVYVHANTKDPFILPATHSRPQQVIQSFERYDYDTGLHRPEGRIRTMAGVWGFLTPETIVPDQFKLYAPIDDNNVAQMQLYDRYHELGRVRYSGPENQPMVVAEDAPDVDADASMADQSSVYAASEQEISEFWDSVLSEEDT